jgi:hypothetical protein
MCSIARLSPNDTNKSTESFPSKIYLPTKSDRRKKEKLQKLVTFQNSTSILIQITQYFHDVLSSVLSFLTPYTKHDLSYFFER